MTEYMSAFMFAAIASLLATPLVMMLASRTGALDVPDARKVHKKPIPRIGGIGIYSAFIISMVLVRMSIDVSGVSSELLKGISGLILSGTLIMLVGVIDDYRNLPAKVKLLGQIFAAAVLVIGFDVRIDFITDPFGDFIYLEWFAVPATIFWLVGLSNTINLIDGLDGLAAGVSVIASFTIMCVALEQNVMMIAILTAALAGAAFGFLFFNFNPASIFMGDSGALFLGFMLAGISVLGAVKCAATIALIVPILALGLPILDTAFAIVRRYRGGVPIFRPDKGHLHHRLLGLGFTQRQAVLLMYVISALLGLSAVALTEVSYQIAIFILLIVVAAILYGAKKLGILSMRNA